ncbi:Crp/Fnr family transcriptional regulator [Jiulongibacter sediminis]|uniref:Cyclic nucleotide-binding protein n=1 Tax=Jiulongibacter sediminis TaxID=1605367 RepID=A0A0N8H973_9BACT|nr:Crp/Fnr family transcriptional regulator [Jiulongibacter sediminis]KPM46572.1 cyclic nucleotide-binding protein [Jiulongibacter sediminis]TBX21145.1 cyclic nucleotide-binding protein [Jiulongibacter sediminis]
MPNDDPIARLLKAFNDIQNLSPEVEYKFAELCKSIEVKKHQNLQSIGQTCRTIYFVNEGAARIYYYKEDKDVTEYFAFENDLIIRAESLFTGKPSHKAIQTLKDTSFIAIPAPPLFELFDQYHDLERLFRKLLEKSYVETINRLESLQFQTAEERYQTLMTKSPVVVREIPLKHIASYLGITQVSLSRIRATIT